MSKAARQQVMDLIKKKEAKIRDIRKKSRKGTSASELIMTFLEQIESVYTTAKTMDDFWELVNMACYHLDEQMKILDRGVKMRVEWCEAEKWQDLRCTGVTIWWSSYYQKRWNVEQVEYIDVTKLLFEDEI